MGLSETVADHETRIARLEKAFLPLGDLVVEIKDTLADWRTPGEADEVAARVGQPAQYTAAGRP